jgi:hypothetical protein
MLYTLYDVLVHGGIYLFICFYILIAEAGYVCVCYVNTGREERIEN